MHTYVPLKTGGTWGFEKVPVQKFGHAGDIVVWIRMQVPLGTPGWQKIATSHKLFLQYELGVRPTTPYAMLLAESGNLPLEAEALYLAIIYAQRMRRATLPLDLESPSSYDGFWLAC